MTTCHSDKDENVYPDGINFLLLDTQIFILCKGLAKQKSTYRKIVREKLIKLQNLPKCIDCFEILNCCTHQEPDSVSFTQFLKNR